MDIGYDECVLRLLNRGLCLRVARGNEERRAKCGAFATSYDNV
ncbi:uncharacterized protein G2W53_012530 [Senna tora]|uniref:Uncharacterized protein n=1 Tax=Senna tora TaxID=362788 RepID=A0A834WPU4_9FABA|nr:uncharacterized protein G2W53_012530 [Senna tora]